MGEIYFLLILTQHRKCHCTKWLYMDSALCHYHWSQHRIVAALALVTSLWAGSGIGLLSCKAFVCLRQTWFLPFSGYMVFPLCRNSAVVSVELEPC